MWCTWAQVQGSSTDPKDVNQLRKLELSSWSPAANNMNKIWATGGPACRMTVRNRIVLRATDCANLSPLVTLHC